MIILQKSQLVKAAKYLLAAILIPVMIGYYNHITAYRVINAVQYELGVEFGTDSDYMLIHDVHNNGIIHPLEAKNVNIVDYWQSGIRSITYTIYTITQ